MDRSRLVFVYRYTSLSLCWCVTHANYIAADIALTTRIIILADPPPPPPEKKEVINSEVGTFGIGRGISVFRYTESEILYRNTEYRSFWKNTEIQNTESWGGGGNTGIQNTERNFDPRPHLSSQRPIQPLQPLLDDPGAEADDGRGRQEAGRYVKGHGEVAGGVDDEPGEGGPEERGAAADKGQRAEGRGQEVEAEELDEDGRGDGHPGREEGAEHDGHDHEGPGRRNRRNRNKKPTLDSEIITRGHSALKIEK